MEALLSLWAREHNYEYEEKRSVLDILRTEEAYTYPILIATKRILRGRVKRSGNQNIGVVGLLGSGSKWRPCLLCLMGRDGPGLTSKLRRAKLCIDITPRCGTSI